MAKFVASAGLTASRYQILCKLAVGGMAEIFLARAVSVAGAERYCVLKRILRDRARDAEFVQMFLDEARLAAQLHHPNIASVYDIGVLGDSYFFTMEYVHGETVRSLLQRAQGVRRSVPLACVLTIVAGAAAGLHHAHERNSKDGRPLGIVHRDVSPSNLMVSYEGSVKVVDFGVAKAADRGVETRAGTVKGKISYMSPEQCLGEQVDRRSDLFSLGIVMWELLTGTRLYRRASALENMVAIVNDPPPPPSTRRFEVPGAVDDIVLRLLAKSVDDRFQTAAEVVEAIANASSQTGAALSASAVSRLARDLFGTRAEPWLELESDALSGERASQELTMIARSLEFSETDGVDAELEAILGAIGSPARSTASTASTAAPPAGAATTAGWMAPAVSTAAPSPQIPIPSAAPSLRSASSPPGAVRPAVFGLPAGPAISPAMASPPFALVAPDMRSPPIALPGAAAAAFPIPLSMTRSASHAYGQPSSPGIVVVGLPYDSVSIAAPARLIATAGANATPPHGAAAATAGAWGSYRAAILTSHPGAGPGAGEPQHPRDSPSSSLAAGLRSAAALASRIPWLLVAVIVIGIAVGVGTAWLSMRDFHRRPVTRDLPLALPAPADRVVVVPRSAAAMPAPAVAATPAPGDAGAAPRNDPPEIDFSDLVADSPVRPHPQAAPAAMVPAPDPEPDQPAVRPTFKQLAAQYAKHDYSSVAASCREVSTRASIAWVCFMAACHLHDIVEAKRWLLVSRPARRAKLAAICQQIGDIDLRASTLACAADRLDCLLSK
jgi:serine/threonine protein kinase